MTVQMEDLGFSKGIIEEVVLSTCSVDGQPNAAPMGVTLQDEQHFSVDLFSPSQTFRNIKTNRYAVINLISNIEAFYRSAFKETNPEGKLPTEWFEKSHCVNAPKLCFADATVEVSVEHMEPNAAENTGKTRVMFKVEFVDAPMKYPQAFNRAMSLTMEAIINATRVKAFLDDPEQQYQVAKLLEAINNYRQIVNRVAPNSAYSAVMDDLTSRIDMWKKLQ
ncbi:MAG: DUF447 family protein [Candidatus Bathyarchaeota archaeon]|nr:DUF447 family protein [Candidatus Bathyarchaeota archaeon]